MVANANFALTGRTIWIAGHRGMVGRALMRRLAGEDCELLTVGRETLDLRRQADVEAWMEEYKPDAVFLCAATVGGILANDTRPAEFIYDNLAIEANVIHGAWKSGVGKLLFMGSACIYPRDAEQPMKEEYLLTGPLEPTNEWYAIAKIIGIKLCQAYRKQYSADFISAQPINLYGPGDRFDLENSHVVPALMLKAHAAKTEGRASMDVWGSGNPMREFLYVDDVADALVFLMRNYSGAIQMNVGLGADLSIRELAETIIKVVGFEGELVFDTSKPDGTPRKFLDTTRLNDLGWAASTSLEQGLEQTYAWFLENVS